MSDYDNLPVDGIPENDDDYDDYYEGLGEAQHLPPDHPLMAPLQSALKDQLSRELGRVELQLRDKESHLKDLRKNKEDTGVQLYGVQQQLARMQMNFERAQDNFNIIERYRKEAEEQLEALEDEYEKKKSEVTEQEKKVNKAQEELNQINRTLRQVEEYNTQMKSEIAVSKRITYRAEESVVQIEKDKKRQDVLIDHMNEEVKKLNEQKNLHFAQLRSQKEQTEAAAQTLREANEEMEKIQQSKRDLVNDWQHQLREMQRRADLIQTIQNETNKVKEEESDIDAKLNGYQLSIRQETNKSEQLVSQLEKHKADLEGFKKKMEDHNNEKNKLLEQKKILVESKKATQAETEHLDEEIKRIKAKISVIEDNVMKMHQETKKIVEDITYNLNEKTSIEKSANHMVKQAKRIQNEISDKEFENQSVKNEISRVKIDVLNTQQWIEVLRQKKTEIDEELNQKEEILKQFDKKIRDNHDELKKKQLEVDRLNTELDKEKAKITDGSSGAEDAKLNHLVRGIQQADYDIALQEKEWISLQTRLVEKQTKREEVESYNGETRNKLIILEQRKLRLNGDVHGIQKEIASLNLGLKNLNTEMNRINLIMADNKERIGRLQDDNRHLESDFVQRLKKLEEGTLELESAIKTIKDNKEQVLAEIVEAERQILLWERKYQLELEMQKTIDPNVGQKEMTDMKKEIHRMELRLDALRKQQDKLIKEMERSVYKREAIQLKYQPRAEKQRSGGSVARQVTNLRNTLRHTTQNTNQIENSIRQRQEEFNRLNDELDQTSERQQEVEQDAQRVNSEVVQLKLQKYSQLWQVQEYQTLGKRYAEIAEGRFKPSGRPDNLRQELRAEEETYQFLTSMLSQIADEQPQFQAFMDRLLDWDQ